MKAPHTEKLYREIFATDDMTAAHADEILALEAWRAMAQKLKKKRREGYGGWWDAERCSIDFLRAQLASHVDKGDMVDVANFAMMIHMREILETER